MLSILGDSSGVWGLRFSSLSVSGVSEASDLTLQVRCYAITLLRGIHGSEAVRD